MLSCREASELIDKKLLFRLSFKEKIQLRMHTSVCKACSRYQKQSQKLDHLIKEHLHRELETKESKDKGNKDLQNKIMKSI
jgi:hypothetical protein